MCIIVWYCESVIAQNLHLGWLSYYHNKFSSVSVDSVKVYPFFCFPTSGDCGIHLQFSYFRSKSVVHLLTLPLSGSCIHICAMNYAYFANRQKNTVHIKHDKNAVLLSLMSGKKLAIGEVIFRNTGKKIELQFSAGVQATWSTLLIIAHFVHVTPCQPCVSQIYGMMGSNS